MEINKINKSTLFNEGDIQQCSTDKLMALEFPIDLEFRNVDFCGGRKRGRKTLGARREPTTNSTNGCLENTDRRPQTSKTQTSKTQTSKTKSAHSTPQDYINEPTFPKVLVSSSCGNALAGCRSLRHYYRYNVKKNLKN